MVPLSLMRARMASAWLIKHNWVSIRNAELNCIVITLNLRLLCDQCSHTFSQKSDMKSHIRNIHEGIRSHQCERCHKSFKVLKCELCPKIFGKANNLVRHIRKRH